MRPHRLRTVTRPWRARKAERTYNGICYDSALEARVAWELDCLLKAGELARVERQVQMPLVVNGVLVKHYYIDFVVQHRDGSREAIEVKGCFTESSRLTWKLFLALYQATWIAHGWKISLREG